MCAGYTLRENARFRKYDNIRAVPVTKYTYLPVLYRKHATELHSFPAVFGLCIIIIIYNAYTSHAATVAMRSYNIITVIIISDRVAAIKHLLLLFFYTNVVVFNAWPTTTKYTRSGDVDGGAFGVSDSDDDSRAQNDYHNNIFVTELLLSCSDADRTPVQYCRPSSGRHRKIRSRANMI